jgi:aspartate/methionine/tyrosine aminotransferase
MSDPFADLTPSARTLPESGIVKVFNYGRLREGLIPLWAGEGDTPTPDLINRAATEALAAGQTFYTYQRGIPELREALAAYFGGLYQRPFSSDEFNITCGGMQAIQMAVQLVVGAQDEVVVPSPAWPNFEGAIHARGGIVRHVAMDFGPSGWSLDLEKLFAACSGRTRAIFLNSPANPTGWTATQEQLETILEFARGRGIWIIADEIYGRFSYHGAVAPSFQTIREPGDRLLFVQTFSKNWAMTGWRMGWIQGASADRSGD